MLCYVAVAYARHNSSKPLVSKPYTSCKALSYALPSLSVASSSRIFAHFIGLNQI